MTEKTPYPPSTDFQQPAAPPPYDPTPQPQPGYSPQPQPPVYAQPAPAQQTSTVVVVNPQAYAIGELCPRCKTGVLVENFTCCGICLGICFFPLGIICCLLMKEKRCTHCGATF